MTNATRADGDESHVLSRAGEDYLESIYRLSIDDNDEAGVRSVDVADQLDVSKASVNKALSVLKEEGMVVQKHYGRVTLTPKGREYASRVWRAHRALRVFLETSLGVDRDRADDEACLMEHVLSADTLSRLITYLEDQGVSIPER